MAVWLILFGALVGVFSGVLGIGGGVILVPGLIMLFGFNQLQAQGTSLAVLSLPICLAAATIYYQNGHVRPTVVALIAVGFVVGAVGGAKFVELAPTGVLRVAFGGLLLYLGLTFVLEGRISHTAAALPAAAAALITTIAARFWRRKHPTARHLPPPTTEFEYHI